MMAGCTDLMGDEGTIFAEKLDEEPDNFINISEQQMEQFPGLKEAINSTEEMVEISSDEWYKLKDFFQGYDAYMEYQGKYYYVRLFGFV